MKKTTVIKASDIKRVWYLIDLKGQTLGRISTEIAKKLMGKSKVATSPNLDCGDYVVCINAKDIRVTGGKEQKKLYQSHSMHPGGFKEINFADLMIKDPRKIIEHSIRGMLPKNKLRADRLTRLKVFADDKHPYADKFEKKEE